MSELSTFIGKIEAWFKSISWTNVTEDIVSVIGDIENDVAPVVEAMFPGTSSTIKDVVTPVLNQAKTAATALTTAAGQFAAGTLSAAQLTQTAHAAQGAAVAAAAIVAAATAKPAAAAVAKPAAAEPEINAGA